MSNSSQPTKAVNLFLSTYDIYVGGPDDNSDPRQIAVGQPGFLGNPFTDGSPEDNLLKYQAYFLQRLDDDPQFRKAVYSMYGRRLGCVDDPDKNNHGTFLAQWLNAHRAECQRFLQPDARQRQKMGLS